VSLYRTSPHAHPPSTLKSLTSMRARMAVETERARKSPRRGGERYAAAIYGSIFVTGLIGALSEENATAKVATVSVVSTTLVFWVAHAWAELLAERAQTGAVGGWRSFRRLAQDEWPIVEAGALPSLALALAWAGVYSDGVGFNVALVLGIAQLLAWGAVVARRTELPWWKSLAVGALDAALGLAIIGLEVLIH
jgi:hypothetical protein